MAWPTDTAGLNVTPDAPDAVRGDAAATDHPRDHRIIAQVILDLLAELGANPSGAAADLTARLTALDAELGANPSGAQADVAARFAAVEAALGNASSIAGIPVVGAPLAGQTLKYDAVNSRFVFATVTGGGGDTTPPAVPTGLAGTPGDGQAVLNWDDNSEGDLAGYRVYRDGGALPVYDGTASAFTDTGRTNGQTYSYTVTAYDTSANESAQSSAVNVTPADVTPPAVPTGLTVTPGDTELVLDWANNSEADLLRYEYRVDAGTAVSTGTTSAATVTGLTNGQTYAIQVRALDTSLNASAWSTAVNGTPAGLYQASVRTDLRDEYVAERISGLADGDPCGLWEDNAGTDDLTATGSARPTYKASGFGTAGKPYLQGTAGATQLDKTLASSVTGLATVMAVFSLDSASNGGNGVFDSKLSTSSHNSRVKLSQSATSLRVTGYTTGGTAKVVTLDSSIAAAERYIVQIIVAAGGLKCRVNGGALTSPETTVAAMLLEAILAANFGGRMAYLGIWTRALTTTEIDTMRDELNANYGVY